jgi:hypothetical protein
LNNLAIKRGGPEQSAIPKLGSLYIPEMQIQDLSSLPRSIVMRTSPNKPIVLLFFCH